MYTRIGGRSIAWELQLRHREKLRNYCTQGLSRLTVRAALCGEFGNDGFAKDR